MHGSERREQIIRQIQESKAPVSGTKLASLYSVSRQVIVQDIALIRAAGYEIISTNRGYILTVSYTHLNENGLRKYSKKNPPKSRGKGKCNQPGTLYDETA